MRSLKNTKGLKYAITIIVIVLAVLVLEDLKRIYNSVNNLLKLSGANPKVKPLFDKLIVYCNSNGYDVIVTGCYYDYAKGVELNALDSRNPVFSYHTFGLAMDINLKRKTDGKMYQKGTSSVDWLATGVPQYAIKIGLRWGGNFSNYYDPIHIDYGGVGSISMLQNLVTQQFAGDYSKANQIKIS